MSNAWVSRAIRPLFASISKDNPKLAESTLLDGHFMEAFRAGFYLEDGNFDLKDASEGLRNQGHERNLNVEDLQISQLDRQVFDDAYHVLRHSVWIRCRVTKCFSCAVHFWGDVFMNTKTTSSASTNP